MSIAGDRLDEALEETFPASDPVAVGRSEHAGTPHGHVSQPPTQVALPPSPARASGAGRPLPPGERPNPAIEWFDDLALGMRFRSPELTLAAADVKRFAQEFDPQPYHLDEEAAKATPLKGLAAPGWHTAAIVMRLMTETRPFGPQPLLGLGVDELRWLAPVRPGDTLHL